MPIPETQPDYLTIENDAALHSYLESLSARGDTAVALDLEAENNLHAYGQKLSLVQISDGERLVLIDVLKINPASLARLFENPAILKVMFGASNDLSLVRNTLGLGISPIIDLEPAVQLLAHAKQNLHAIIAAELGIVLTRKNRFQKHNWLLRPLSREAIEYALNDVRYLSRLKEILLEKLKEKGLFEAFLMRNARIQNKDYTRPAGLRPVQFGGHERLSHRQRDQVQAVYAVVDRYAAASNIPSFWIIGKSDIIRVVRSPRELSRLRLPGRMSPAAFAEMLTEITGLIPPA
jgi:ribonuclease D